MSEVNWTTVISVGFTVCGALIILGKQLQIIKNHSDRMERLEKIVENLTKEVTRLTTILEILHTREK